MSLRHRELHSIQWITLVYLDAPMHQVHCNSCIYAGSTLGCSVFWWARPIGNCSPSSTYRSIRFGAAVLLMTLVDFVFTTNGTLQADTTVGGRVQGNVTWTPAEGPYVAIQSVEVPAGSTLTIEPGVEIRFSGHSFVVRGTLLARGTAEAPIRFTSQNLESPSAQDWGLLTFEGKSSAARYDQALNFVSGSIIEHVIVEYGHGLFFNGGAPLVSHCTIRHHRKKRGGGVYAHGCNIVVIRNSIISNNVADEEGGGIRTAFSQPVLIGNTIVHNSARYDGGGISMDYNTARIEENTISFNFASHAGGVSTGETQLGQTSVTGRSHSQPQILRNRITNNTAYYSGGGIFVKGTPVIVGNVIAGNRIHYTKYGSQPSDYARIERKVGAGAGIKVTDTYGGPLTIQGNVIAGNRGAYWGAGMCFDRASGKIRENWIVGNQADPSRRGRLDPRQIAQPLIPSAEITGSSGSLLTTISMATPRAPSSWHWLASAANNRLK